MAAVLVSDPSLALAPLEFCRGHVLDFLALSFN